MIIRLKVFEQTLSIVDTKSVPRKGSKDYLVLQFMFSSDWKDLNKLCYLQSGEVSQPIEVVDNLVEVPEWFTQQDRFYVTLFGKSGTQEVPTNVVSLRLEKSNTLWEQDAPEPQPSWLAKVIDLNNHPPIPGGNGYWLLWDTDNGAYVESELPLSSVDAVLYTEQSLTEVQQKQARSNIGAGLPPYIVTLEMDDDGNLSFPGTYRDMEDIAAIFYSGRRVLTIIDDANRTKRVFVLTAVSRTSDTLFVGQLRFTTAYTSSSGASSVVDEIVVRYSGSSITVIREKSSISLSEIRYFTTNAIIPTKIYQGSFGYWYILSNYAFSVITENPGKYSIAYVPSLYGNLPLYLSSISDSEIIYKNTAADGSWVGFKIGANSSSQDCGPIEGNLNVQPDWNQNDETQPDYVKNRPFYTGDPVETEVLVEESTVTFEDFDGMYSAQVPSTFEATVGETYKVYWDGAAYECTCVDVGGLPAIGNPSIVGAGSDTGEPFLMGVANGERIQIVTADTSASHTISISAMTQEIVKLDPKYIDSMYYTEIGVTSIEGFEIKDIPHDGTLDPNLPLEIGQVWNVGYKQPNGSINFNWTLTVQQAEDGTLYLGTYPDVNNVTFYITTTSTKSNPGWVNNSQVVSLAIVGVSGTRHGEVVHEIPSKYIPVLPYMDKKNPTGTGAFSLNRHADTYIGSFSFAEGYNAAASGNYSHAEGYNTAASGNYSHAEGYNTAASGDSSHAEGYNTAASGNYSHAEGYETTALGMRSHAEGYSLNRVPNTITSGSNNTTIFNAWKSEKFTLAKGLSSHAEGTNVLALDDSSHAEGYETTAMGVYSHAEGYHTAANGYASHAECGLTIASGNNTHAEGYETTASGVCSHAEGNGTIARGYNSHVQGKYNIEDSSSTYAHIVGNGTDDDARSNAHTLDWSGNAWFAGTIEGKAIILPSSTEGSTKKFKITVDDSGTLTAELIPE